MRTMLRPLSLVSSIYGRALVFVGRSSPNASRWLPRGDIVLDMLTSGMLTIIGNMPVVCAASVSTAHALNLLSDAGFQLPHKIHRYFDAADYIKLIKELCANGYNVVTQHVHPISEISRINCWIDPALLSFVNNKANLEKFVPDKNIPYRNILPAKQIFNADIIRRLPIVIKAVTDESTGGGIDVRICRSGDDIKKAAEYFEDCHDLVVEEYLDIQRNLCLHYCVSVDGSIDYLGFTEQVSDERGIYRGNWVEVDADCPAEVLKMCVLIVRTAYEYGYHGILGIDVAVLKDESFRVFDLNFRINGSAPALLYARSVYENYRKPVIRLRRLIGTGNYQEMLNAVYRAMAKGILLPLGSCDPEAGPYILERPLLTGIILGETRQEIWENEHELVSMGLDI